jgi:diguanylate cyclase (GGDEF)-like protein
MNSPARLPPRPRQTRPDALGCGRSPWLRGLRLGLQRAGGKLGWALAAAWLVCLGLVPTGAAAAGPADAPRGAVAAVAQGARPIAVKDLDALDALRMTQPDQALRAMQDRVRQAPRGSDAWLAWTTVLALTLIEEGKAAQFQDVLATLEDSPPATHAVQGARRPLGRSNSGALDSSGSTAAAGSSWGLGPELKQAIQQGSGPLSPAAALAQWLVAWRGLHQGQLRPAAALLAGVQIRRPDHWSTYVAYRFTSALAWVEMLVGHHEQAARSALEASVLADQMALPRARAAARLTLSAIYAQTEQMDLALLYLDQGRQFAQSASAPDELARSYTLEARWLHSKDEAAALKAAQRAVTLTEESGLNRLHALALGQLAHWHLRRHDYPEAVRVAREALQRAQAVRAGEAESFALSRLALATLALGDAKRGQAWLKQAIETSQGQGNTQAVADVHQELGRLLEHLGQPEAAVRAYHTYRQLKDPLLLNDQQAVLLEQQAQFDAENRGRDLELLARQSDLELAEVQHSHLRHLFWLAVAGGLVLVVGVLVALIVRLRRHNHQLSVGNTRLRDESERDALTQTSNRRHLQRLMDTEERFSRPQGTLLLLDIDHFKSINDQHGHAAGDAVLVEAAARLRATLRGGDLLVRWGGEEFLIVVPNTRPEQVAALAQRLLQALGQKPIAAERFQRWVTVSIGYASFPLAPEDLQVPWESALGFVDAALYLAKAKGRNRACGVRLARLSENAPWPVLTGDLQAAEAAGHLNLHWIEGPMPQPLVFDSEALA